MKQELEKLKQELDKVKEPRVGVLEVAGTIPFEQLVNGTKSKAGP